MTDANLLTTYGDFLEEGDDPALFALVRELEHAYPQVEPPVEIMGATVLPRVGPRVQPQLPLRIARRSLGAIPRLHVGLPARWCIVGVGMLALLTAGVLSIARLREAPTVSAASILRRGANAARLRNGQAVEREFGVYFGCSNPLATPSHCRHSAVRVWKYKVKGETVLAVTSIPGDQVVADEVRTADGFGYSYGAYQAGPGTPKQQLMRFDNGPHSPAEEQQSVIAAFLEFDSPVTIRSVLAGVEPSEGEQQRLLSRLCSLTPQCLGFPQLKQMRVEPKTWAGRAAYGIRVSHQVSIFQSSESRVRDRITPSVCQRLHIIDRLLERTGESCLVSRIQRPGHGAGKVHGRIVYFSYTVYFDARTYALLGVSGRDWGMTLRRHVHLSACLVPNAVVKYLHNNSGGPTKPGYCHVHR